MIATGRGEIVDDGPGSGSGPAGFHSHKVSFFDAFRTQTLSVGGPLGDVLGYTGIVAVVCVLISVLAMLIIPTNL